MTPRRRVRTGQRRDGGVRRIRTDTVRNALAPNGLAGPPTAESTSPGQGLQPARDTGLELNARLSRSHRRTARAQRRFAVLGVVVLAAVVIVAAGWKSSSDRKALLEPVTAAQAADVVRRTGTVAADPNAPSFSAVNQTTGPTPLFASYKDLEIRLPVAVEDLTEAGFHQASYAYARHLKSLAPYADAEKAKKARTTHRDVTKQETGIDAVLTGKVLKMWRNRPGKPDTAVDVGADAGATVYAPVTGTVVKVKEFDLYEKYPDVEVHIQPDGYPTLDLVMIHIDDVTCVPGDRVVAGVTAIATIRDLDKRVGPQLKSYTKNGGTHTHIQVNDATHPKYKGLKGAITVEDPQ